MQTVEVGRDADLDDLGAELAQRARVGLEIPLQR